MSKRIRLTQEQFDYGYKERGWSVAKLLSILYTQDAKNLEYNAHIEYMLQKEIADDIAEAEMHVGLKYLALIGSDPDIIWAKVVYPIRLEEDKPIMDIYA